MTPSTPRNCHSTPCHPPFDAELAVGSVKKYFLDGPHAKQPAPANRHRKSPAGAETPEPSAGSLTEAGPPVLATRVVSGLCVTRHCLRSSGGALQRLELSVRWCPLQQQLLAVSLQAPALEALSLTVNEPLDPRWAPALSDGLGPRRQTLDMHSGTTLRFPSLKSLVLECLPLQSLHFTSRALPRLRHLRLSCCGHLLSLTPYQHLHIEVPSLEALEVAELAVWNHVDLALLSICPNLRLVTLTELWVLNPVANSSFQVANSTSTPKTQPSSQPSPENKQASHPAALGAVLSGLHGQDTGPNSAFQQQSKQQQPGQPGQHEVAVARTPCFVHELALPSCRVLHVRNSLNALGFELWAPRLQALHLLCTKMFRVRLMTPKPPEGFTQANVTLLRDMVDEESLRHLRRHGQVGQLFFDDQAGEEMQRGMQTLQRCVSLAGGGQTQC